MLNGNHFASCYLNRLVDYTKTTTCFTISTEFCKSQCLHVTLTSELLKNLVLVGQRTLVHFDFVQIWSKLVLSADSKKCHKG